MIIEDVCLNFILFKRQKRWPPFFVGHKLFLFLISLFVSFFFFFFFSLFFKLIYSLLKLFSQSVTFSFHSFFFSSRSIFLFLFFFSLLVFFLAHLLIFFLFTSVLSKPQKVTPQSQALASRIILAYSMIFFLDHFKLKNERM